MANGKSNLSVLIFVFVSIVIIIVVINSWISNQINELDESTISSSVSYVKPQAKERINQASIPNIDPKNDLLAPREYKIEKQEKVRPVDRAPIKPQYEISDPNVDHGMLLR